MCLTVEYEINLEQWLKNIDILKQTKEIITYNRRTRDPTIWRVLFVNMYNVKILQAKLEFEFIGISFFRGTEFPFIARGNLVKDKLELSKINYISPSSTNQLKYSGTVCNGRIDIISRLSYGASVRHEATERVISM
jgi:hypothetical protein